MGGDKSGSGVTGENVRRKAHYTSTHLLLFAGVKIDLIDFHKELEKFDFAAVDENFNRYRLETSPLVETLNTTLKRIGKELNHTNMQIEDFLAASADEQEKDQLLANRQKAVEHCEGEKHALVETLVTVLDQFEDLYRFIMTNNSSSWAKQIHLLWEKINAKLLRRGVTPLEGTMIPFDPELHTVVEVKEDRSLPHSLVLETLRRGYLYQSKLIRKAQVVVNTNEEGSGHYKHYRWD